jgi:cytosine/adenosine deaminase-related metal-dependent hydrolase
MHQRGICVSLGADGAACNDNLDAFMEMRLAALIQKPRVGATALPASAVLRMATIESARALGLDSIGSLELGKKADLIIIDLNRAHLSPMKVLAPDVSQADAIAARLVYSARSDDVRTTIVDGRILMDERELVTLNEDQILQDAETSIERLANRLGWWN